MNFIPGDYVIFQSLGRDLKGVKINHPYLILSIQTNVGLNQHVTLLVSDLVIKGSMPKKVSCHPGQMTKIETATTRISSSNKLYGVNACPDLQAIPTSKNNNFNTNQSNKNGEHRESIEVPRIKATIERGARRSGSWVSGRRNATAIRVGNSSN